MLILRFGSIAPTFVDFVWLGCSVLCAFCKTGSCAGVFCFNRVEGCGVSFVLFACLRVYNIARSIAIAIAIAGIVLYCIVGSVRESCFEL